MTHKSLSLAGLFFVCLQAQPQASTPQSFEVASIKKHKPGDRRGGWPEFLPGGKFTTSGAPLYILIAIAYDLPFQSDRLTGGPGWVKSEEGVYDIEAKAEDGAIPAGMSARARQAKMKLMLQGLLADRFKLVIHHETKELPVYALLAAKDGPKLHMSTMDEKDCPEVPTREISCHQIGGGQGRGLHGKAVDMSDLVLFVANWTDRPMVDRTGIKGLFDVETDGWLPFRPRPAPAPGAEPSAEDIAMADPARPTLQMVLARLGLRMETQKAPVEMYVIDHVEKPTEN
jgi:uncharacterized protein (TIGR03435 family)